MLEKVDAGAGFDPLTFQSAVPHSTTTLFRLVEESSGSRLSNDKGPLADS